MDVAMATNFVLYRTFSLGAEVSQDLLDRFSLSLHDMAGIELQIINPTFFLRYLKGRYHGNQLNSKNWRYLWTNLICRAAIRKVIVTSQFQFQKIKQNENLYILYILVTFSPETSEVTLLTIAPFVAIRQKLAYHAKYLRMFWTSPTLQVW